MLKYVVAYLYLGDGYLRQSIVYAESKKEAIMQYCRGYLGWESEEEFQDLSMDEIEDYFADCDSYINVIEV